MIVSTETGSTYLFDGYTLTRMRGLDGGPLVRDGEEILVVGYQLPEVGRQWEVVILADVKKPAKTRRTSRVTKIEGKL